jgi:hypothetical protein
MIVFSSEKVPEVETLAELNGRLAAIDAAEDGRHVHGSPVSIGFAFAAERELLAPLPEDDFDAASRCPLPSGAAVARPRARQRGGLGEPALVQRRGAGNLLRGALAATWGRGAGPGSHGVPAAAPRGEEGDAAAASARIRIKPPDATARSRTGRW